jgi:predicted transposase YdaD
MAKKTKKLPVEGNLYDKIFKENAEDIFIPLVEERLGIKIKSFRPLREKMQTTIEREMDFFYEVETEDGEIFILHLEFQTEDDHEMLYRTGEYHGMALRRKRLEIKHVVVYLGSIKPTMPIVLKEKEVYRGFELIDVHSLDYKSLLISQVPRVILLAILANYPKEQTESVLRLLIRQLRTVCKTPSELSKYLKQLIILSRLRKIENLTIKITEEMPITYNIETDYLYLRGTEKGIEKGIEKGMERGIEKGMERGIEKGRIVEREQNMLMFVTNLILNSDFDDFKIAQLSSSTLDFVRKIRNDITKDKQ